MTSKIAAAFVAGMICFSSFSADARNKPDQSNALSFVENKGQVTDQYGGHRDDIRFAVHSGGLNVFLGGNGLHYQFSKRISAAPVVPKSAAEAFSNWCPESANFELYRMDVELVGANPNAELIATEPENYAEHYYLGGMPVSGIHAAAYGRLVYKNIYNGIDWVLYMSDGKLKHEFLVQPGGNIADIQIKYNGQSKLQLNADGSITATTPMGSITEQAPVCVNNGRQVQSHYKLNGNVLSYDIAEFSGGLVIDPTLTWGTYYGPDSIGTFMNMLAADDSGNVYIAGLTYAQVGNIASVGSYQSTSGGATDAMMVKFDSAGHRVWGTYYGGSGGDNATGVAYDRNGGIYLVGNTTSTDSIATPGGFLTVYPGSAANFLAKFTTGGERVWATYVGHGGINLYQCVACDTVGHVYLSGVTTDVLGISTPGSYMPAHSGGRDCFLVAFDTSGTRAWGTYYGGPGDDFGGVCASDGSSIYLCGYTYSTSGIATPGAFQPSIYPGGDPDAFVVKFTNTGGRVWGTYYGGNGAEVVGSMTCGNGSIYLLANTGSDLGIASPGAFQSARAGMNDVFLARFEPISGNRLWATYFGGPGEENSTFTRMVTDNSGRVCIAGKTTSTSGIASACAWQSAYGGGDNDAFLAKFDSSGARMWSTYYGGSGDDEPWSCMNIGPRVYMCGFTNSTAGIATPGSFLSTGGTSLPYYQGFLAKFLDQGITTISTDTMFCATNETFVFEITAPVGTDYVWYDGDTSGIHWIDSAGTYGVSFTSGCQRVIDSIHVTYNYTLPPCNVGVGQVKGVEELLSIYPNPAGDACTVSFTGNIAGNGEICIYDIAGRLLRSYALAGANTEIRLSDLSPGAYECSVKVGSAVTGSKKLIIIR